MLIVTYKCVCVCWTFTLPILVLDIGLYFTLEHYSYLWRVCACVRAHAGVCMCVCAQVCECAFRCCFVSANGLLVDVCQCCCLLMFVCLPLSRHFTCCKTWWIKNLNLNLNCHQCIVHVKRIENFFVWNSENFWLKIQSFTSVLGLGEYLTIEWNCALELDLGIFSAAHLQAKSKNGNITFF